MKVLIVEDEGPAVDHLTRLLVKQNCAITVLDQLDSVKSAVKWFEQNPLPDLAFFDIQLADGKSFEIFEKVNVSCPIIFTTAYDQYALKAFQVNSIDYLLKPIKESELQRAIQKFQNQNGSQSIDLDRLKSFLGGMSRKSKEQFVIKVGEHLKTVLTEDIVLFYSYEKSTYIITNEGKKFIVDYTLEQLEDMVDPSNFFRVNRKYLISMKGIKDMISYSNSRLKISMRGFESDDLIVSRERVGEFKSWLDC